MHSSNTTVYCIVTCIPLINTIVWCIERCITSIQYSSVLCDASLQYNSPMYYEMQPFNTIVPDTRTVGLKFLVSVSGCFLHISFISLFSRESELSFTAP